MIWESVAAVKRNWQGGIRAKDRGWLQKFSRLSDSHPLYDGSPPLTICCESCTMRLGSLSMS
jgi:hypothetical protein